MQSNDIVLTAEAQGQKIGQLEDQKTYYQEQLVEKEKQIALLTAQLTTATQRKRPTKREARSVSVPRSNIGKKVAAVNNLSQVQYEQHRCRADGSILSQYSSIHMQAGGDNSRNQLQLPETVEEQSQNNTTMQTSVFFDEDLVRD